MRVVFAGTPEVAVPALEALLASRHEVVAVLTRPDAPVGRHRTPTPSPVKAAAQAAGVPVIEADRVDARVRAELEALAPDLAVLVAYGALVPAEALAVPVHGWVNLHFSLLPDWRGAAPVQHAIIAGDTETGACVIQLETGLDTGPVYARQAEPIGPEDTAGELLDRLSRSGAALLARVVDDIGRGSARAVAQSGPTRYAHKLTSEGTRVDWDAPAEAVDRAVRGATPAPGAWTTWSGARFKLGPVVPRPAVDGLAPGHIAVAGDEVLVGTGAGAVALGLVRPAGRREMPARDWARGQHDELGAFA